MTLYLGPSQASEDRAGPLEAGRKVPLLRTNEREGWVERPDLFVFSCKPRALCDAMGLDAQHAAGPRLAGPAERRYCKRIRWKWTRYFADSRSQYARPACPCSRRVDRPGPRAW